MINIYIEIAKKYLCEFNSQESLKPQRTGIMRESVLAELNTAEQNNDKRKITMLRLILAAIDDRTKSAKLSDKKNITDEEILEMLHSMVKQREESARNYDESGHIDQAEREREEIDVLKSFIPEQLDEDQIKSLCTKVIKEIGATGLRDMGRAMTMLKQRYSGQMDFSLACRVITQMLKCDAKNEQIMHSGKLT